MPRLSQEPRAAAQLRQEVESVHAARDFNLFDGTQRIQAAEDKAAAAGMTPQAIAEQRQAGVDRVNSLFSARRAKRAASR